MVLQSQLSRPPAPRREPLPFALLTRIERLVMGGFLLAALFIGTMQIVLRYVFNTGFVWTEGLLIVLTIWAALFGASQAIAQRIHIRVEVFADHLPQPWRRIASLVAHLVTVVYCGVLCYGGILYVRFVAGIGVMSIDMGIPEWWIYAIVPISMGAFVLRYLHQIWKILRREDEERPHHVALVD